MTKSTNANEANEAGNAAIDKVSTPGEMVMTIRKDLHDTIAAVDTTILATARKGSGYRKP